MTEYRMTLTPARETAIVTLVQQSVLTSVVGIRGVPGPPGAGTVLTPAERLAASGIWYGTQAELDALDPAEKRTVQEWMATGSGYFEFHVFAEASGTFTVVAVAANLGLAANSPVALASRAVAATGAGCDLSANVPSVAIVSAGVLVVNGVPGDLGIVGGVAAILATRKVETLAADLAVNAPVPIVTLVPVGIQSISAVSAALDLTGDLSAVKRILLAAGTTAALPLASGNPTVSATRLVNAAVAANLGITGNAPTAMVRVLNIAAATAALAVTGTAPAVSRLLKVDAAASGSALSAPAPSAPTIIAAASPPTQPVITATGGDTTVTIALSSGGVGATSYNLKWGTSSGNRTNTVTGVTLPYVHTGRTNGTPYYYSLVAVNGQGSTESSEVSATPAAASLTVDTFNAGTDGWSFGTDGGGAVAARSTQLPYEGAASLKLTSTIIPDPETDEDVFYKSWATKTVVTGSTIKYRYYGNAYSFDGIYIDDVLYPRPAELSYYNEYTVTGITPGTHTLKFKTNDNTIEIFIDNVTY